MRKVKVAIIDDGIDFKRIGISGIEIDFCENREKMCMRETITETD